MYKRVLISAVSLLASAVTLGAQAQPYGGRGPMPFGTMNLDGDGYVPSGESSQHRDTRMAARAAQDRLLRNASRAPTFESRDADGNRLLNAAEVTSGQQTGFAGRRESDQGI